MPRQDTPEEAKIRAEIEAKGVKGLSPKMVLRVPKDELEPLVLQGMRDHEICKCFQVSHATINFLRKFYGLPTVPEALKILENAELDRPETEPQKNPEQKVASHPLAVWPPKKAEAEPEPKKPDEKGPESQVSRQNLGELVRKAVEGNPALLNKPEHTPSREEALRPFLQKLKTEEPAPELDNILMHHTYHDEAVIIAETVMGLVRSLALMKSRKVLVEIKVREAKK